MKDILTYYFEKVHKFDDGNETADFILKQFECAKLPIRNGYIHWLPEACSYCNTNLEEHNNAIGDDYFCSWQCGAKWEKNESN